jgi:hypothetical protein
VERRAVAAVGAGNEVDQAVAVKVPELGTGLGSRSPFGNARVWDDLIKPIRCGIDGLSHGADVPTNKRSTVVARADEQVLTAIAIDVADRGSILRPPASSTIGFGASVGLIFVPHPIAMIATATIHRSCIASSFST